MDAADCCTPGKQTGPRLIVANTHIQCHLLLQPTTYRKHNRLAKTAATQSMRMNVLNEVDRCACCVNREVIWSIMHGQFQYGWPIGWFGFLIPDDLPFNCIETSGNFLHPNALCVREKLLAA